jgi:TolA protein
MINPEEVMSVTAIAELPRGDVAQVATRRPSPPEPEAPPLEPEPPAPAPPPVAEEPAPPPPPTASDMKALDAKKKKEAEEQAKRERDNEAAREARVREMEARNRKEQLLRNAAAQTGDRDQEAADPKGSTDASKIAVNTTGRVADPVLAAYYEKVRLELLKHWVVSDAVRTAHPEYKTVLYIKLAADGTVLETKFHTKTGDPSYDNGAQRAVLKAGKLPPPPEKYRESITTHGFPYVFATAE